LVLPCREFSTPQLQEPRDERRRCAKCVGALQCSMCQAALPVTDFSWAQQRKAPEARRCGACVRGDVASSASSVAWPVFASRPGRADIGRGGAMLQEVFTGFGAQAYWRSALVLHRAFAGLPQEVVPRIQAFLGDAAGTTGTAELGARGVCAVCDVSWPCALQSVAAHRGSRRHRRCLADAVATRQAAEECAEAARAAGVLAEALAAEAARAPSARARSASALPPWAAHVAAADKAGPSGSWAFGELVATPMSQSPTASPRRRWGRRSM